MALLDFLKSGSNAQKDVQNFVQQPNWRSAAGIAGTFFNAPEGRVSEAKAYEAPTYTPPPSGGQSTQNQSYNIPSSTQPNNSQGQVLGAGTTGTTGTGYEERRNEIQGGQDRGNDLIEQDYNNVLGSLAGQESGLQSQAGTAQSQIENEGSKLKTQLGQEQSVKEQGVESTLATGETEATTAMQQARDLFRQTQQNNIAQLSALGISSSSVAEALAERLGVETARRIAGVTGSISELRVNSQKELARVKDYFQQKMTDVQDQIGIQKSQIQNALMEGLNKINSSRQQAATDKARARADLLQNTQRYLYDLGQQEQAFQQSLQKWAQQKQAALTPLITDPNFMNTITSATNQFNQQFAPQGFQYSPQVNTSPAGNVQGQVKYTLSKNPEEDEFGNPFSTQQ